jgi:hypothetical protein
MIQFMQQAPGRIESLTRDRVSYQKIEVIEIDPDDSDT